MTIIRPLHDRILAELTGLDTRVTASGIIIQSENGKDRGIRPRWAKAVLVGEGIDWVKPGQYILVAHGRWSRQFECEHNGEKLKLVHLDNKECLIVSDELPDDNYIGVGIDTKPDGARAEDFGAR
jgi:co-chaperonin GroES (HSP10)